MLRAIVCRRVVPRAAQIGVRQGRCVRRCASSAAGGKPSGEPSGSSFAALSLGAIVTLGSVLLVSPLDFRRAAKPAEEGEKPAGEGEKPAEQSEKPAEQSEKPAEQSEKPAEQSEKPAEQSEKPAEQSEKPAEQSEKPAEQTEKSEPSETSDQATLKSSQGEPAPEDGKSEEGEQGDQSEEPATAYNPDTGEINWDCPCLGGMAEGPCGEEFKSAFSCFVYSEADPKGIDCVEKFQHMQDCFRQHPEHYAEQLKDEEEAAASQQSVDPVIAESDAASAKVQSEKPAAHQGKPETQKEASKSQPNDPKN